MNNMVHMQFNFFKGVHHARCKSKRNRQDEYGV